MQISRYSTGRRMIERQYCRNIINGNRAASFCPRWSSSPTFGGQKAKSRRCSRRGSLRLSRVYKVILWPGYGVNTIYQHGNFIGTWRRCFLAMLNIGLPAARRANYAISGKAGAQSVVRLAGWFLIPSRRTSYAWAFFRFLRLLPGQM